MTIESGIECDSISTDRNRITTFVLRYPRFIHCELMTHRQFSRNASSSRAIPVKKILKTILTDMASPIHWGANQSGMQAYSELKGWRKIVAVIIWRTAGIFSVLFSWFMTKIGTHKQIANRLTEPFSHISVVVTGSDHAFANFFALRCHSAAQPEIRALAEVMWEQYKKSVPTVKRIGEWHLPFIRDHEVFEYYEDAIKVSVARCARVSYLNHDGGKTKIDEDMKLYDRLVGGFPKHSSPAEHPAIVCASGQDKGNLTGWKQHRAFIKDEYIKEFKESLG